MQTDRFKNYDAEVRELVLSFEEMKKHGLRQYYDVDQMVTIVDFYLEQTDIDLLEDAVAYAEQLFPTANEVRLRRSHLYSIKGQDDKALRILLELERLEPQNTDVQYALGAVYSMLNQPHRSIQHYQRASADGYELGMVYGNIADEYYKLGSDEEAIRYYKRSLAKNKEEERSLYNLCALYCDILDENPLSPLADVDFYEQFVSDNPYSKVGWFCLGGLYVSLKLWEKAIDAYEFATTIDKTYYAAYMGISQCYEELKRPLDAVSVLREALDYAEDKPHVYHRIATIYQMSCNYATAVIYYRKALNEDPYHYDSLIGLAESYDNMSDYSSAVAAVERAIAINPQSAHAMWMAATIHERHQEEKKAEAMFNCAIHLEPDVDMYWLSYADFLILHEHYAEAADILGRGASAAERPCNFYLRLAACYFRLGQRSLLFNAVRDYIDLPDAEPTLLFDLCPEMETDIDVVNIINSK